MILRDSLPYRTIQAIAQQRRGREEGRSCLVLELVAAANGVRTALRRDFADLHLTELDFEVLVTLFALDPEPSTPAMLASHTACTRAALTDVVDRLEAREFVRRERYPSDRRSIFVRLTKTGAAAAHACVLRLEETAMRIAQSIPAGAVQPFVSVCAEIAHDVTPLPATSALSSHSRS